MAATKAQSIREAWRRFKRLLHEEIWHPAAMDRQSAHGRLYALLRVFSITGTGIRKNKIFSESAALAYASLLSLGPIVSLIIIVTSFVLQKNSDKFATQTLNHVVTFIAPSATEFEKVSADDTPQAVDDSGSPADESAKTAIAYNPKIVDLLDHLVSSARSKTVGAVGLIILIVICIQMIVSIETTFNSIWGVRRGRNMLRRIVLYWTVFSLGMLMAFTAGTLLSAKSLSGMMEKLPFGLEILNAFGFLPKLGFFVILVTLLALFYRFIPNTRVHWKPALIGGFIVALCLDLNNYLSFLYVSKAISTRNLYGAVGIIPILMFGLYIFWLLILLGGQLAYAVQNVDNISDDRLWSEVSSRTRRLLSLSAFMHIARTFVRHLPGPTSEDLSQQLRVPANILNQALNRLQDMKLISPIEDEDDDGTPIVRYQPGQPLHLLTLGQFQHDLDVLGHTRADDALDDTDPVLPEYLRALTAFEKGPILQKTFADLLGDAKPA